MEQTTPYRLVVELNGAPELPNDLHHLHWRAQWRHTHDWRIYVTRTVGARRPRRPLTIARVRVDIWRKREADPHDLIGSIKPLLDGLRPPTHHKRGKGYIQQIGCGVLIDDRAGNFEGGRADVVAHLCGKGESPHVRITVEEV